MYLSKIIYKDFDPKNVLRHIEFLTKIHRITVTDGYEKACDYIEKTLREYQLKVERIKFPANYDTEFLGFKSIKKWIVRMARLEIIYPSEDKLRRVGLDPVLADFSIDPLSIVQRSFSTPKDGIEAEIISIADCYDPRAYSEAVKGKIVLIDGDADKARPIAVEKYGACGIVTDLSRSKLMREDSELQNARVYQSFWCFGGEKNVFGFVITPRQGMALRKLLDEDKVIVRAYVDSDFVDDTFSVVSGLIEGKKEDEEIWVTSHLDHPMPCAEDNASGVGVSLEVARVLKFLVDNGKIPKFERGIRFLYMSEFMGTAAYVSYRYEDIKSGKVLGALNLDMVGADEKYGGSLLIIEPPYDSASYVAPLMRWLVNYLISTDPNFAGAEDVPLFRWGISKFSAGSDYYILTDPIIGVSTVALNRWPYKYHHTNLDTLDKISCESIRRVGMLASMFLGILATINSESVDWLAEITKKYYLDLLYSLMLEAWTRVLGNFKMKLFKEEKYFNQETFSRAIGLLNLISNAGKKALILLRKHLGEWWDYERDLQEIERESINMLKKIKDIFGLYARIETNALRIDTKYAEIVPRRTGKLFDLEGQLAPLTYDKIRQWWSIKDMIPKVKYYPIIDIVLFKADGKKTLERIIREIYYEFGVFAPDGIYELFKFFEKIGLVELA